MRLTVLGAGPAYTDRQGASGACYLVSEGDTHLLLDLGQGSFPRIFPHVAPRISRRSWSATSTPTTSSTSCRCATTCATSSSRRAACGSSARRALAARLDALHAQPGFTAGALDTRRWARARTGSASLEVTARLVTHTDESYAIRVAGADRAGTRLQRRLRPRRRHRAARPTGRHPPRPRSRSGPGRFRADVQHLDGPAVGRLAAATGAGRVLLTHLQMGYDPDETVASVRAATRAGRVRLAGRRPGALTRRARAGDLGRGSRIGYAFRPVASARTMDAEPTDPMTPADPDETDPTAITPAGSGGRRSALLASAPGRLAAGAAERVGDNLRNPLIALLLILIASVVVRVIWLDLPGRGLIFDEAYYVQAARTLLGWAVPEGAHYAGKPPFLDPNTEHPPLGKLLMAASMAVFGDNGIGWRLPSVIAGLVVPRRRVRDRAGDERRPLARRPGGVPARVRQPDARPRADRDAGHARPGPDPGGVVARPATALGARRRRARRRPADQADGHLCPGAILLLFLFHVGPRWWRRRRVPLRDLRGPIVFLVVTGVVAVAGLAVLDARFTTFATPFDHIRRMVDYGSNLRAPVRSVGICPAADSRPWSWLFNECQIQYLRVDVTVRAGEKVLSTVPRIDFRGALNPLLAGTIPLAMLFGAWYAWRARSRTAQWAIAWAAANYLPYIALALATRRIMYLYYFLPVVPAVAVALAILLLRAGLPRPVRLGVPRRIRDRVPRLLPVPTDPLAS